MSVSFSCSVIAFTASEARPAGESRGLSHGCAAPAASTGTAAAASDSARAARVPLSTDIDYNSSGAALRISRPTPPGSTGIGTQGTRLLSASARNVDLAPVQQARTTPRGAGV